MLNPQGTKEFFNSGITAVEQNIKFPLKTNFRRF